MLAEEDVYICPAGNRLAYSFTTQEHGFALHRYLTNVCQHCAIKHRCTTGKERRITRWEHEHILEAEQTQARRASGKDAPAAGDGRASVRHHQSPHGCHALSDEDTAASCLRDGAARTRPQSHPCHEHHGYRAAYGRDQGIANPSPASALYEPAGPGVSTRPRPIREMPSRRSGSPTLLACPQIRLRPNADHDMNSSCSPVG